MVRIYVLLIGYCFGLFQTAYIYGKLHGIDIREEGSGNAGTTNALRTLGMKAGVIVMVGDIVKCILAVAFTHFLFGRNPETDYLVRIWTGFGCILGHNFPFYMNFRGGKGVACTAGLINSISLKILTPIGNLIFFGTVLLTGYVSLASLLVGAEFMIGTVIMGQLGCFHMKASHLCEMYILVAIIVCLMFFQHRGNIARLLKGTERKTKLIGRGK